MREPKCKYPIGTQEGKTLFCGRYAAHMVEGYRFCELHTMMALCAGLDIEYTDGDTPRQIIERDYHEQLQRRK